MVKLLRNPLTHVPDETLDKLDTAEEGMKGGDFGSALGELWHKINAECPRSKYKTRTLWTRERWLRMQEAMAPAGETKEGQEAAKRLEKQMVHDVGHMPGSKKAGKKKAPPSKDFVKLAICGVEHGSARSLCVHILMDPCKSEALLYMPAERFALCNQKFGDELVEGPLDWNDLYKAGIIRDGDPITSGGAGGFVRRGTITIEKTSEVNNAIEKLMCKEKLSKSSPPKEKRLKGSAKLPPNDTPYLGDAPITDDGRKLVDMVGSDTAAQLMRIADASARHQYNEKTQHAKDVIGQSELSKMNDEELLKYAKENLAPGQMREMLKAAEMTKTAPAKYFRGFLGNTELSPAPRPSRFTTRRQCAPRRRSSASS